MKAEEFKETAIKILGTDIKFIRGILTKEKNSYFIELFLDKHKYYDRRRKDLGL